MVTDEVAVDAAAAVVDSVVVVLDVGAAVVDAAAVVDSVVVVLEVGAAVVVLAGTAVVLTPVLLVTGFVVEVVVGADSVLQPTSTAAKAAEMQTVLII